MSPLSQYVLLGAAGLFTGFAVHHLSASVRGSITRHLVFRYLIEGIGIVPGVALMGFVLGQRGGSPNVFELLRVGGAFFVPHVAARIAAYTTSGSRRLRREYALPFEHWFDLLKSNAPTAREFLTTYLTQNARQHIDSLPGLRAACITLEETNARHPLLPTALGILRAEIARLELARGA